MNPRAPLSEQRIKQAFKNSPRGELGSDFGRRVLARLDPPPRPRGVFSPGAVIGCWTLLAAAAVAVMATVDWHAIEPTPAVATVTGGGLLLCLGALAFLLRISRARFMNLLWRTLFG